MKKSEVVERAERVVALRADLGAVTSELRAGLADVRSLRAFCDASEADLARRLAEGSSFPEKDLAAASQCTLNEAGRTLERARTLDAVPELAGALDNGHVTGGHVDALTRASKHLDDSQTTQLFDKAAELIAVGAVATVPDFGKRVRNEVSKILADDGVARFERQKRSTSLSTWVDDEGMWRVSGRFDPVTGVRLAARLEATVETLFAESTPPTCPPDPIEKQKHLRALALSRLVGGDIDAGSDDGSDGADGGAGVAAVAAPRSGSRPVSGRPEFVVVIDASVSGATGHADITGDAGARVCAPSTSGRDHLTRTGPPGTSSDTPDARTDTPMLRATWPIPIEVPTGVLAELLGDAAQSDVSVVVVADGLVLHGPGRLDLGRATRLANRAQRRALRGLYSDCAIPGCRTHFDRCKLHHVHWWRHGGRTDLANLLPVCSHHHHKIHDEGWTVELGARRELTLTLPDGNVMTTGPPQRNAA